MHAKKDETPAAPTDEVSILSNTFGVIDMSSIAKANSGFTIFNFGDAEIRVVNKNGEPWFVAKDVCSVLSIANSRDGIARLDEDEKGVALTDTLGGQQELAVVSESGMYTLVLRCRDAIKPGTVPHSFRKWVTSEVLPAIRKTGQYETPRKTTVDQRTPLRDAVNMLVGKKGLRYDDAYNMVHQRFSIASIDELGLEQIPLAVEYIHRIVLDGEFIGKQGELSSLEAKQFTDQELYELVCLLSMSLILKDDIEKIIPALNALGSDWGRVMSANMHSASGFINGAGKLLMRECEHIGKMANPPLNWRLELSRMQSVIK